MADDVQQTSLRLPAGLYARVAEAAGLDERSINSWMVRALERATDPAGTDTAIDRIVIEVELAEPLGEEWAKALRDLAAWHANKLVDGLSGFAGTPTVRVTLGRDVMYTFHVTGVSEKAVRA